MHRRWLQPHVTTYQKVYEGKASVAQNKLACGQRPRAHIPAEHSRMPGTALQRQRVTLRAWEPAKKNRTQWVSVIDNSNMEQLQFLSV